MKVRVEKTTFYESKLKIGSGQDKFQLMPIWVIIGGAWCATFFQRDTLPKQIYKNRRKSLRYMILRWASVNVNQGLLSVSVDIRIWMNFFFTWVGH